MDSPQKALSSALSDKLYIDSISSYDWEIPDISEVADDVIATLNEEAIANEEMYDGFYAVITDIDDDPSQIIAINKRRWQIEECFRIMKTEFRLRPVKPSLFYRIDNCFESGKRKRDKNEVILQMTLILASCQFFMACFSPHTIRTWQVVQSSLSCINCTSFSRTESLYRIT